MTGVALRKGLSLGAAVAWWALAALLALLVVLIPLTVAGRAGVDNVVAFSAAGAGLPLHVAASSVGPAHVVQATALVHFARPGGALVLLAGAENVLGVTTLLVVVGQVRRLLRALRQGSTFAAENPRRLMVIGVVLVGSALLAAVMGLAQSAYFQHVLSAPGLHPRLQFPLDLPLLGAGLLLVVLAEVFRQGRELAEDQRLTV